MTKPAGKQGEQGTHLIAPDLIRLIACIMVVCVHLAPLFLYQHWLSSAFFDSFGILGVPLFVMLTGYLLLGRDYSEKQTLERFLKGNLLRLLVAFEVWNAAWWALGNVEWLLYDGCGLPIAADRAVKAALFVDDTGNALWYFHMSIALYLGIPIVAWTISCLKKASPIYGRILLGCLIFFGCLVPTVSELAPYLGIDLFIHSVLQMNIFGASVWGESVWVLYLLVGYLVRSGTLRKIKTSLLTTIMIVSFACILYISLHFGGWAHGGYASVFVVVASTALFELVNRSEGRLSTIHQKMPSILQFCAARSFGVYVIHIFVIGAMCSAFTLIGLGQDLFVNMAGPLTALAFLLLLLVVLTVSFAVVQLLSLIRPIRHWALMMR